jgi:hypothetical protein
MVKSSAINSSTFAARRRRLGEMAAGAGVGVDALALVPFWEPPAPAYLVFQYQIVEPGR